VGGWVPWKGEEKGRGEAELAAGSKGVHKDRADYSTGEKEMTLVLLLPLLAPPSNTPSLRVCLRVGHRFHHPIIIPNLPKPLDGLPGFLGEKENSQQYFIVKDGV